MVALVTIPVTVIRLEAADEELAAGVANVPRIDPFVCPAAAAVPTADKSNNRVLRYPGYLDDSQCGGKCSSSRE